MSDIHSWDIQVSDEPPPPPEIPWELIGATAAIAIAIGIVDLKKRR